MAQIALPGGHHYAVTWGIPDAYTGMTSSMLHRSRAFVQLAGTEVTILTYEHRDDYDVIRKRLEERGAMIDGMHLRNLWEDLRSWDDEQIKQAGSGFVPGAASTFAPLGNRGDHSSALIHVLNDDDGALVQVDYFRPDGTLLVSDRRRPPGGGRRSITLCDTSGQAVGAWNDAWELYWAWLDTLPREPVAWLIADSKTTANHLARYRREDVVTMHVIRGSHLEAGPGGSPGALRASRKNVLENLDAWDAVVFLTRQQLDDVDALLGPGDNRHVIPNCRSVADDLPDLERPSTHGVMLAKLVKRKQIGHAIAAMKRVGRFRRRRVTLDVWGDGPARPKLQDAIDRAGVAVRLRGHSATAREEFATASFSLLTSASEGFGNVLLESMAGGCIPISYSTPYGPEDIITDGVDGFLVPQDDIRALATRIRRVAASSPAELAPMRAAAYRRALDFDDAHVTQQWADLMAELLT